MEQDGGKKKRMTTTKDEKRERAEQTTKYALDHAAEQKRQREAKTARLRALRLASESRNGA